MSFDYANWDHLRGQGYLLLERLACAWLTTHHLLLQRQRLIQRHQELVLQRQRLVERHEERVLQISPFRVGITPLSGLPQPADQQRP